MDDPFPPRQDTRSYCTCLQPCPTCGPTQAAPTEPEGWCWRIRVTITCCCSNRAQEPRFMQCLRYNRNEAMELLNLAENRYYRNWCDGKMRLVLMRIPDAEEIAEERRRRQEEGDWPHVEVSFRPRGLPLITTACTPPSESRSCDAQWKEWRDTIGRFLMEDRNLQPPLILRTERLLSATNVFTRWTRKTICRGSFHRQLLRQISWLQPSTTPTSDSEGSYRRYWGHRHRQLTFTQYRQREHKRQEDYEALRQARNRCSTDLLLRARRRVLLARITTTEAAATIDEFLPWTEEWMCSVLAPAPPHDAKMTCNVCTKVKIFSEPAYAMWHARIHIDCFNHGEGYPCCRRSFTCCSSMPSRSR
jgi:hypothetical protein